MINHPRAFTANEKPEELRSRASGYQGMRGELVNQMRPARVLLLAGFLLAGFACAGCDTNAPATSGTAGNTSAAETKPAEPAVPPEFQAAANALLGSEAKVLLFGDLAHNGKQQVLAANVLPKTPTNTIPGTVVTRAVIVEKDDDKWNEVLLCDEHLKNTNGLLALTPRDPVTGWRLQYEQDAAKGLQLYFTPEHTGDAHVLPIGVAHNPKTNRYQSLDRAFEKFLPEVLPSGETPRSSLKK
jgi:hypothetical protein